MLRAMSRRPGQSAPPADPISTEVAGGEPAPAEAPSDATAIGADSSPAEAQPAKAASARGRGTLTIKVAGRRKAPEPRADARVVDRHGPVISVERNDGVRIPCLGHGKGKTAVVGDEVFLEQTATLDSTLATARITSIAPRRNALVRTDAMGRKGQTLAANIDRLYVVVAIEPPLRVGLIDRYLVAADQAGIEAHVLLNKVDLITRKDDIDTVGECLACYPPAGAQVHFASASTGHGIADLKRELRGRTSMFVGHSGVGKTSLLNALSPGLGEAVRALSDASGRGTHTTSRASLYRVGEDAFVIDSPGVRGFSPWDLDPGDLKNHFPDLRKLAAGCRFADCQHLEEPSCSVREAVESGDLADSRYDSYLKIRASLVGDLGRFW